MNRKRFECSSCTEICKSFVIYICWCIFFPSRSIAQHWLARHHWTEVMRSCCHKSVSQIQELDHIWTSFRMTTWQHFNTSACGNKHTDLFSTLLCRRINNKKCIYFSVAALQLFRRDYRKAVTSAVKEIWLPSYIKNRWLKHKVCHL